MYHTKTGNVHEARTDMPVEHAAFMDGASAMDPPQADQLLASVDEHQGSSGAACEHLLETTARHHTEVNSQSLFAQHQLPITDSSGTSSDSSSFNELSDSDIPPENENIDAPDVPPADAYSQPLYTGCSVTVASTLTLVLCMLTKHRLKRDVVHDLFNIINIILSSTNGAKNLSSSLLNKFIQDIKYPIEKHFYCKMCGAYVEDPTRERCQVEKCGSVLATEGSTRPGHFIVMPIAEQLSCILSVKDKFQSLKITPNRDSSRLGDVTDGKLYRNMMQYVVTGPNTLILSLLWSCDGVSVFRSSHYSMWPFYLAINELPQHLRFKRENLILGGVFFGRKKPLMLTFMRPIFQQLKALEQGLSIETPDGKRNVQCYVLAGTADLPARAMMLNMVQFNGSMSCHKCYNAGETYQTEKGGNIHIYKDCQCDKRTDGDVMSDGRKAIETREIQRGMKGPSVLSYLSIYSYVDGTGIDCMHGSFLGVKKQLLNFWFSITYKNEPFSVNKYVDEFNKRVKNTKPPLSVNRPPRTLDDLSHYKASEFATCLLFYLPLLYGILPNQYLMHVCDFSEAMYILYQKEISRQDLQKARSCIRSFVEKFPDLYGQRYMTSNLHNLTHLVDDVENLGPVWNFDAFAFESVYGQVLKLLHGTQCIDSQIVQAVSTIQKLPQIVQSVTDIHVKELLCNMLDHKWSEKETLLEDDVYAMGPVTSVSAKELPQIRRKSCEYFRCALVDIEANTFKRFRKGSRVFHTKIYSRVSKRNSYTVQYFDLDTGMMAYGIVNKCYTLNADYGQGYTKYNLAEIQCLSIKENSIGRAEHLKVVSRPTRFDKVVLVPLKNINKVCVWLDVKGINNCAFLSLVPNITYVA